VKPWRVHEVWESVAAELRGHRADGLSSLITEDTVRFATARALVAVGCEPGGLRVEWPHPALPGSRVDLVVGGLPPAALVEFKYPREPTEQNAAWTMTRGEVLKDFYRLAAYAGDADRIFVYVETGRLHRYMAGRARVDGIDLDRDVVELKPANAARLPATAARIIGAELAEHHVVGRRFALIDVDSELRLIAFEIDALRSLPNPAAISAVAEAPSELREPSPRPGVRGAILEAARAVLTRSGGTTFIVADVVAEMRQRGSSYAESTVRTMVTSHMCSNAPDNSATTYQDFDRVDRATYRFKPTL
jgi:hypothetical protein